MFETVVAIEAKPQERKKEREREGERDFNVIGRFAKNILIINKSHFVFPLIENM